MKALLDLIGRVLFWLLAPPGPGAPGAPRPSSPAPPPPPPPVAPGRPSPDVFAPLRVKSLFAHYSTAEAKWDASRWPYFKPSELACPCCGLYMHDPVFMDALCALRAAVGVPLVINSGTRCPARNKAVGGAARSMHVPENGPLGDGFAVDIALAGVPDWLAFRTQAKALGFAGLGHGATFLHLDRGAKRVWDYGPESLAAWRSRGLEVLTS